MPKRDTVRRINNAQAKPATRTVGSLKSVTQPPSPSRDLGGWTVGDKTLSAGDLWLHRDGWIKLGTGDDILRLDVTHALYRAWAGNDDPDSAKLTIDKFGYMKAVGVDLEGTIKALLGELHALTVRDRITIGTNGEIVSDNYAAGVAGLRLGADGKAELQDAVIRGELHGVTFVEHEVSKVRGTLKIIDDSHTYILMEALEIDGYGYHTVTLDREGPALAQYEYFDLIDGELSIPLFASSPQPAGTSYELLYPFFVTHAFPAGSLVVLPGGAQGHLLLTADPILKGPRYAAILGVAEDAKYGLVLGNLDGTYGISAETFGIGIGDFDSGNYLRYEPGTGLVIRGASADVELDDITLTGSLFGSTPLGCVVYRDSAQSINNNSFTTLRPNTEQHDIGDCWAAGNPERFVAPEAGYYSMSAHLEWAIPGNNAGSREIIIQHRDVTPTFQRNIAWQKVAAIANTEMQQSVSANRIYMAGGTYLIVVVRQTSGLALNVAAATADVIYKHSMRFARVA